jgi:hypothetical protein
MKRPDFWFFVRLFIGGIFVYAGFSKLAGPVENFRAVLAAYHWIPVFAVPLLAHCGPWCELIFGVFVVTGFMPRWSSLILALFSLMFVGLLGGEYLTTGKFPEDCGCFGHGFFRPTVPQVFALDILNFLLGVRLFLLKEHPWSLEAWLKQA